MALSIGEAVGEGFRLVGRRPFAVWGWGLFANLAVFAVVILFFAIAGFSSFATLSRLGAPGATPSPEDFGALMAVLAPMMIVFFVIIMLVNAVVHAAVLRSVLQPDSRSFASIRVGVEEAVLVLLYLVYFVFAVLLYIAVFAILGAVAFLGHLIGNIMAGVLTFLVALVVVPGAFWVGTRFALAAPMSFAERRVRFFGAWELSRGHGWQLYGLAWLLALIAFGLFIAYYIVSTMVSLLMFGAGFASLGLAGGGQGLAQNPGAMMAMWPVLLIGVIVSIALGSAFAGGLQAVLQAPWAAVYRQLRGSPDVASTFT